MNCVCMEWVGVTSQELAKATSSQAASGAAGTWSAFRHKLRASPDQILEYHFTVWSGEEAPRRQLGWVKHAIDPQTFHVEGVGESQPGEVELKLRGDLVNASLFIHFRVEDVEVPDVPEEEPDVEVPDVPQVVPVVASPCEAALRQLAEAPAISMVCASRQPGWHQTGVPDHELVYLKAGLRCLGLSDQNASNLKLLRSRSTTSQALVRGLQWFPVSFAVTLLQRLAGCCHCFRSCCGNGRRRRPRTPGTWGRR